jgi:hypothetical protein
MRTGIQAVKTDLAPMNYGILTEAWQSKAGFMQNKSQDFNKWY